MTEDEIRELRAEIGAAVIEVQNQHRANLTPEDLVPEIVGTLIALAAFIAKENTHISFLSFMRVCRTAAQIEWHLQGEIDAQ